MVAGVSERSGDLRLSRQRHRTPGGCASSRRTSNASRTMNRGTSNGSRFWHPSGSTIFHFSIFISQSLTCDELEPSCLSHSPGDLKGAE